MKLSGLVLGSIMVLRGATRPRNGSHGSRLEFLILRSESVGLGQCGAQFG